jgi:hypothetical protein
MSVPDEDIVQTLCQSVLLGANKGLLSSGDIRGAENGC